VRIVHVTNEPFGLQMASGVQHVVYCLARAQAETGESVTVFTRDDEAVHVLGTDDLPTPRRQLTCRRDRSLRERVLFRYFERRLTEDVLASIPDIVHFHSIHIPENVVLAACLRRAGVPYCVTVHGALFSSALYRRRMKKAVFNLLFERNYLNNAHFIHALNVQEEEVLLQHGINRPVVVVPNGLPPATDVRASRPDTLYASHPRLRGRHIFMFIGRMDAWQKGLDLLIEAFARARLRDAALVLIGPDYGGSRHTLATLADRLGVSSEVVFIEPVFGEDRANMLAAADVFVHPSRWEGVSLSVLAAAAAGKPCLITREADPLGGLEQGQAAIIVKPSVSSITEGLKRATELGRPALRDMGGRARRVAEGSFTWNSIAVRLIEAYQSAVLPARREDVGHQG